MKIKSIILALLLGGPTYASDFSDSETSYSGASILEGDWDVSFETAN